MAQDRLWSKIEQERRGVQKGRAGGGAEAGNGTSKFLGPNFHLLSFALHYQVFPNSSEEFMPSVSSYHKSVPTNGFLTSNLGFFQFPSTSSLSVSSPHSLHCSGPCERAGDSFEALLAHSASSPLRLLSTVLIACKRWPETEEMMCERKLKSRWM